jgi:hypothetical protein
MAMEGHERPACRDQGNVRGWEEEKPDQQGHGIESPHDRSRFENGVTVRGTVNDGL